MNQKLPCLHQLKVYGPVPRGDGIHRPMPKEHSACCDKLQLRELIAGINPETATVDWACRKLPLGGSNDDCWAFFVEAAPGMWIIFDDLPQDLAEILRDKNYVKLLARKTQRPFSADELAALVDEINTMDPASAVCDWNYAEFFDPYGFGNVPHAQVGREHFVKASDDRWVWFGDLPNETRERLYEKHIRKLAFPAGLEKLLQRTHSPGEPSRGE